MLSRVRFIRVDGEELVVSLRDATSGYSVLDIEGLDPVPAQLASSPFAQRNGSHFHSSRREARDIKFTLGLEASPLVGTVRHLRTKLYEYLMPGSNIRMRFITMDGGSYDIWGRVETFDAPIFVSDAQSSISIRCFDPDFFRTGWTNRAINSTTGASPNVVEYEGSVPSGFIISGNIPRAAASISFTNTHPAIGIAVMGLNYEFQANDHLTLTTVPGEKGILLKRGGQTVSILKAMSQNFKWWELHPGANSVRFYAPGTPSITLNLGYNAKYGGL